MGFFDFLFGESEQKAQQTQQAVASPQEQEFNKLLMSAFTQGQPGQQALQGLGTQTISGILQGGQGLPSQFQPLFAGIGPQQTAELAREGVADILPQFQQAGILDSGVARSIAGRTAGDIRRQVAESNLNRLQQLLGIGLQAGQQQQMLGQNQASQLGNQLAGLRTQTGTSTVTSPNPFLSSFQGALGTGIGGQFQLGGPGEGGFDLGNLFAQALPAIGTAVGGFFGGPPGAAAGGAIGGGVGKAFGGGR